MTVPQSWRSEIVLKTIFCGANERITITVLLRIRMQVSNMPVLIHLLINITICGKSIWRITRSGQARMCHLCFFKRRVLPIPICRHAGQRARLTQRGSDYPCRDTVTNEKGLGAVERKQNRTIHFFVSAILGNHLELLGFPSKMAKYKR